MASRSSAYRVAWTAPLPGVEELQPQIEQAVANPLLEADQGVRIAARAEILTQHSARSSSPAISSAPRPKQRESRCQRLRAMYPLPTRHSAMTQNTGIMPSAPPTAPKSTGIPVWLMLMISERTPTASAPRPAGAVL
jgi:hypothetical protein